MYHLLLNVWYRKRPRLDRDSEADDVTVKTEPLIPGLDLVDDADISAIKEEDILDTGAIYIVGFFILHCFNTVVWAVGSRKCIWPVKSPTF